MAAARVIARSCGYARCVADEQQHFGEEEPFSLGLEEELFVVDRADGRLVNSAPEVLEQLGELERGSVKNELHRSQIELITGVCSTVADAVAELCELRCAVLATGVGVVASGTHPTACEGESQITEKPRYQRIHHLLGDAGATPVSALHIHVGMPDAATAIRVFNGCAATCRCWRHWPPTPRFATVAIPGWPRRAS